MDRGCLVSCLIRLGRVGHHSLLIQIEERFRSQRTSDTVSFNFMRAGRIHALQAGEADKTLQFSGANLGTARRTA